jgi:glutaconate CoA-transferase subunit A
MPTATPHVRGNLGVIREAARASRKVIVIAEEVVPREAIRSDPNRTLIPGFLVAAVVHLPRGCHPAPCEGYYGRDHEFFHAYHERSRTRERFLRWLEEWVLSVEDHEAYLKRLGRGASLGPDSSGSGCGAFRTPRLPPRG